MLRRRLPRNDPEVARAVSALGRVLENAGRYPEAIRELEEAVRLQTGRPGLEGDLSASLTELANCHFYTGQYAQADALNQQVLAIDRRLYGPRHPHVADDLINLGAVQFEGGHYARGRALEPRGAGDHDRLVRAGPPGDRLGADHPRPRRC